MKIKDRSFPYPVLSPLRDDVEPNTFTAALAPSVDSQSYYLDFKFDLPNKTLAALINSKKAKYSIHVECRGNFFRELHESDTPAGKVAIPVPELNGTVEVSFFIIAATAMDDYRIEGSHADYGSRSFRVREGDILAVAPSIPFEAEKEHDPLKRITSIFQVVAGDDLADGAFGVAFENEKITVFLSRSDFEKYGQLRSASGISAIFAQGIVLPVLAQAIDDVRRERPDDPETSSPRRWFRVVQQRLREMDPHFEQSGKSSLEMAQQVLGYPLGRCFNELLTLTKPEDQRE